MTQAEFVGLCEEAGNISSPDALLDYLHNCGTVFYRRGLFGDRIILDQAWALDAVYAVFDRDKSYRNLQRYRGRFTRSDLGQWIWDAEGYATEEQELFLSLMQQCGICFRLRWGDHGGNIESEYIAPARRPRGLSPLLPAPYGDLGGRSQGEAMARQCQVRPGRALLHSMFLLRA